MIMTAGTVPRFPKLRKVSGSVVITMHADIFRASGWVLGRELTVQPAIRGGTPGMELIITQPIPKRARKPVRKRQETRKPAKRKRAARKAGKELSTFIRGAALAKTRRAG